MTSRFPTRSTRSSTASSQQISNALNKKSLAILGLRTNNENLARPPLNGKGGLGIAARGGGLKDASNKQLQSQVLPGGIKRKADTALDNNLTKKRSVLGDVTNAIEKTISQGRREVQKLSLQKKSVVNKPTISSLAKQSAGPPTQPLVAPAPFKNRGLAPTVGNLASVTALPQVKPASAATSSSLAPIAEPEDDLEADSSYCEALPSSQELKLTLDSSNYVTASEASPLGRVDSRNGGLKSVAEEVAVEAEVSSSTAGRPPLPEGVEDYDKECEMDPFAVAIYANDIFTYYKKRESQFTIEKYLHKQPEISESMRSILVDWMVEVQESFELNHETLYLAVKLMDTFLSRTVISRDQLQLVGSTALFIACKFDERVPPYVDDFLYICDDAYKRRELIQYEIKMLKVVGFDLGIPLSYRYLRRYARCGKISMEELTLSRYILELSLMEYQLLDVSDSAVAAAALLLARCITAKNDEAAAQHWTPTLQHYSGFKAEDLFHLVTVLHGVVTQPPKDHLKTVRNKYSHEVFYEVAKIPVPESLKL